MIIRGWQDLEEVTNNFRFSGEVLIADKFIDEELNLSGSVIVKLNNGLYSVISRENIEYGINLNGFESTFFDIENTLNFLKLNMSLLQNFSFTKIKTELNK